MMRIRRRTASVLSLAGSVIAHSEPKEIDERSDHSERAEDDGEPGLDAEPLVPPTAHSDAQPDGRRKGQSDRVGIGEPAGLAAFALVIGLRHGGARRARPPPATTR